MTRLDRLLYHSLRSGAVEAERSVIDVGRATDQGMERHVEVILLQCVRLDHHVCVAVTCW
eukprot:8959244-Pyramimonas_sp.AAC.1